jgi:Reverse transcriptase (RNA-dependent DNA polymerase)
MPSDFVVAKLDFSNAFNSLRRDAMLTAIKDNILELYQYCYLVYSQASFLNFGPYTILSQEGPQQGDPLGPLLFRLAVHPLLTSLLCPLNEGYLDDLPLGGPEDIVASDTRTVIARGTELDLHLKVTKCELLRHLNHTLNIEMLKTFIQVDLEDSSLLGAPLFAGRQLDLVLAQCCSDLSRAIDKLDKINSHDVLILLRSSFSAPKSNIF